MSTVLAPDSIVTGTRILLARPTPPMALARDLWIITSYFNPASFRTKLQNYHRFIDSLQRLAIPHLIIECAFGDSPFQLPSGDRVLRVRSSAVLWQKERLLNVAIGHLPSSCTKVAWVDCDVLFEDPTWYDRTSAALDVAPVVQPFTTVVRLPKGQMSRGSEGDKVYASFAAVYDASPEQMHNPDFAQHGHTGFAWAARRELLERHGLFDVCLAGSADHLMAHAFCGDWRSRCIENMLGSSGPYRDTFEEWASSAYKDVRGTLLAVEGCALHLWHGAHADRQYDKRNRQLGELDFNPRADLTMNEDGAWEWARANPSLHDWARSYFSLRHEDGC